MKMATHLSISELEAGKVDILNSPKNQGVLQMIVRRPKDGEREIIQTGELHPSEGLVGDNWKMRGSSSTPDGSANPAMQITLMNSRAIALIAREKERWAIAGDQLFVDFDLSIENLPPGARLAIGSAILEISAAPHTGCKKFLARFGKDALQFVNSTEGKKLRLRGVNASIVKAGTIRAGDKIQKISPLPVCHG